PVTPFGFQALFERLRARAAVPVDRAVELGCGVGRGLAALKQGAKLVVGVDRSPGALKLARRILRGETTRVLRRNLGRTYTHATIEAGDLRAPSAQLVCADALEPPFAPGAFDRVAALNLLDVVREPRKLLHELHLMAAPRAELLLASPYAWRTGVVDEGQRLGEADPVAALHKEAHDLGWAVEQEDLRVPWILRRDARAASLYEVHWLRARRP
ncbi:MAG: class I SAM-dependent methyltransferase, partial [Deltaproteobacteria bacterium]|nr:class I SAM-dependent methyltransferase [Deltaproteobacteria bacterium]